MYRIISTLSVNDRQNKNLAIKCTVNTLSEMNKKFPFKIDKRISVKNIPKSKIFQKWSELIPLLVAMAVIIEKFKIKLGSVFEKKTAGVKKLQLTNKS